MRTLNKMKFEAGAEVRPALETPSIATSNPVGLLEIQAKVVDMGGAELTNFVIDSESLPKSNERLCNIYIENLHYSPIISK